MKSKIASWVTASSLALATGCGGSDPSPSPGSGSSGNSGVGGSSAGTSGGAGSFTVGGAGNNATGGTQAGGTGGSATSGGASGGGAGGAATAGAGGSGGGDTASACENGAEGAHYVDSAAGDDSLDGTTPETAWKTLDRVNAATFRPGDSLCFRAGGKWTGELAPQGSGEPDLPIVIDKYGSGELPLIAAGSADLQALLLHNVQYWEVNHLELTNDQPTPGDYRGILVRGKDVGVLDHIVIRNCFIHDVTGVVNWIGGDVANNDPPWVTFKTGWDASKRTGGIVFEIESENGTRTWFNDVLIENNVIKDTSFGGIVFKQLDGGRGWGTRASKNDANFTPHTNVVLRGNYLSQSNTDYGCNTIYVTGAQHVLIERNVCKDSGTSAIEAYNSDDVVIQYNEAFGTVKKAGGADSNGIDADRATTGVVIQHNYVHDNGDGILLCQFAFGDSVVRYNLIVDNERHGINLHSDDSSTNETYNNLIFIQGLESGDLINSSGGSSYFQTPYVIRNNILRSTRAASVVATGPGITYSNNLFFGVPAVGSASQSGDPLFADVSSYPVGDESGPALHQLAGFQVDPSSPARDHGVAITDNGGVDFWGNPLYAGTPDIGPFERP